MTIDTVGEQTNLTLEEGVPHSIPVTITNPAGEPMDLTDRVIVWQARRTLDSADPLLDKTTLNGGISNGGPSGQFVISIDAADLVDTDWTSAIHEAKIRGVMRVFAGTVTISKGAAV